ncbi:hypothetical protein [Rhizobium leguminosarum]|uniref:hypothetical protein n=1 Tax=Rhizobium leguminosarum TaxID=384 RepID=UPI000404A5FD|nr:hypothetical protein [Rhizobium leguminosarum]
MFIGPLLILIVVAILLPKLTRFLIGCAAFGVLFMVSSCIDQAHAGTSQDMENMITNASAFANCSYGRALGDKDALRQIKMMGGDSASALAMSCAPLVESYVHFCVAAGYAEEHCYGDLKLMAEDALTRVGN